MLDGTLRRLIDRPLGIAAARLADRGVRPDQITVAGLVLGLAAAAAIAVGLPLVGLGLVLVSRLADGLDGAVAAKTRRSDLGGYLDIVFDFIFYGAVPLGFALSDPAANAVPAAVLLFAFYANGASFLAFSVMAEKRGLTAETRGRKSLYFTTGLAEAGETLAAFCLACLVPAWFPAIAYVFAAMTALTCVARVRLACRVFR